MIQAQKIKRILKDYKEILENPSPGISIAQLDDADYYKYIVNIEMIEGPLKGVKMQLKLHLSNEYPMKAPSIELYDGQDYLRTIHHHIYGTQICFDLLGNTYMRSDVAGSGWSSSYTFKTFLQYLQIFLQDPDYHNKQIFEQEEYKGYLNTALEKQKEYKQTFQINGQDREHTWENPIAKFPEQKLENEDNFILEDECKSQSSLSENGKNISEQQNEQKIKNTLNCYFLNDNILDYKNEDNKSLLLGFPINMKINDRNIVIPTPQPELLSLEGFKQQIQGKDKIKQFDKYGLPFITQTQMTSGISQFWNYFNSSWGSESDMRTAYGQNYNSWLPIYLSKQNLNDYEEAYLGQLQIMEQGVSETVFSHEVICQAYPKVLTNMIDKYIQGGANSISQNSLQAYIHILRSFYELYRYKKWNVTCENYMNSQYINFMKGDEFRGILQLGDIGEFLHTLIMLGVKFYQKQYMMDQIIMELTARNFHLFFKNKKNNKKYSDNIDQYFQEYKSDYLRILFIVEIFKKFGSEKFLNSLERTYGLVDEKLLDNFVNNFKEIQKNVNNFSQFYKYLGYKNIKQEHIIRMFRKSDKLSFEQGYQLTTDQKYKKYFQIKVKQENKTFQKKELDLYDEICKDDPFAVYKDESKLKQYDNQVKQIKKQKAVNIQTLKNDLHRAREAVEYQKKNYNTEGLGYNRVSEYEKKQRAKKQQQQKIKKQIKKPTNMFELLQDESDED